MPILLFLVQFRTVASKWGIGLHDSKALPEPTNRHISLSLATELRPGPS